MDYGRNNHSFREKGGRVILLGDGNDFPADSGDDEMFDQTDEDKDLESQVKKSPSDTADDSTRIAREETPAPSSQKDEKEGSSSESSATVKPAIDEVQTGSKSS